jgi:hypothetical protein
MGFEKPGNNLLELLTIEPIVDTRTLAHNWSLVKQRHESLQRASHTFTVG